MKHRAQRLCAVLTMTLAIGGNWTGDVKAAPSPPVVDIAKSLPMKASGTFVVDRLHHHLLVAGGSADRRTYQHGLLVLDPDGTVVADVLPSDEVIDVSIAPDGRTAWLAVLNQTAVYRLDLLTLAATVAYSFPDYEETWAVAAVTSRFVAVGIREGETSATYVLDAVTGRLSDRIPLLPEEGSTSWVRAIPETSRFVTMSEFQTATVYELTTGTPQIVGGPTLLRGCARVTDLSIASDGHSVVPICADQPAVVPLTQYRLPDLSVAASYPLPLALLPSSLGPAHLSAASFSADGAYLAVGDNEPGRNVVLLHRTGTHWSGVYAESFGVNTQTADRQTADRGIQLNDDGTVAYVLVEWIDTNGVSTGVTLHTLPASPTPIARASSKLTVAAPASAPVNTSVAVSGTLRFSDNSSSSLPAGRQITIARTLNGHTVTVTETLDATGSFRFLNTPTAIGTATYVVTFPGDQLHTGSTATVTVQVGSAPDG